jgi:hypothetical protein
MALSTGTVGRVEDGRRIDFHSFLFVIWGKWWFCGFCVGFVTEVARGRVGVEQKRTKAHVLPSYDRVGLFLFPKGRDFEFKLLIPWLRTI